MSRSIELNDDEPAITGLAKLHFEHNTPGGDQCGEFFGVKLKTRDGVLGEADDHGQYPRVQHLERAV